MVEFTGLATFTNINEKPSTTENKDLASKYSDQIDLRWSYSYFKYSVWWEWFGNNLVKLFLSNPSFQNKRFIVVYKSLWLDDFSSECEGLESLNSAYRGNRIAWWMMALDICHWWLYCLQSQLCICDGVDNAQTTNKHKRETRAHTIGKCPKLKAINTKTGMWKKQKANTYNGFRTYPPFGCFFLWGAHHASELLCWTLQFMLFGQSNLIVFILFEMKVGVCTFFWHEAPVRHLDASAHTPQSPSNRKRSFLTPGTHPK